MTGVSVAPSQISVFPLFFAHAANVGVSKSASPTLRNCKCRRLRPSNGDAGGTGVHVAAPAGPCTLLRHLGGLTSCLCVADDGNYVYPAGIQETAKLCCFEKEERLFQLL